MHKEAAAYFLAHGQSSAEKLKEKICQALKDGDDQEALRLDNILFLIEKMALAANPEGQGDENIAHRVEMRPLDSA